MKSIAELFFLRPWAVKEDLVRVGSEIINRHLRGEKLSQEEIEARTAGKKTELPGYSVVNGTAFIPVYGVIAKRSALVNGFSQPTGTSVEAIRKDLNAAIKDKSVNRIVLNIDSPGGSADGIAELSDSIYSARKKKEIVAFTDGQMDSAAYWIGSAANKIYATKGAEIGSIGVYAAVRDFTVMEHNAGVKTSVIKAGRYKAAGHPSKPLTEDDQAVIQEEVNAIYELFKDAITRNRGFSSSKVEEIATGRVFISSKALELGLIDGIEGFDSVFNGENEELTNSAENRASDRGKVEADNNKKEEVVMDFKTITLDQLKAERLDLVEAVSQGVRQELESKSGEAQKSAVSEAMKTERQRVSDILAKAEAYAEGKPAAEKPLRESASKSIKDGLTLEAAESEMKSVKLALLEKSAPQAAGPGAEVEGKAKKTHMEKAQEYKEAHKCSWEKALRATAE